MGFLLDSILCILGGSALAWGCLPPAHLGWAAWWALAPLLWAICGKKPLKASLLGWAYGTAGWMTAMHWMLGPTAEFLRVGKAGAIAVFSFVWALHGLAFGVGAGAAAFLEPGARRLGLPRPWSLAAVFVPVAVAGEGFFPMMIPGVLAYGLAGSVAQLQSLELFGTAGLAWLICAVNAAIFGALREGLDSGGPRPRQWAALGAALLAVSANAAYGWLRVAQVDAQVRRELSAGAYRVGLIQGALSASDREGIAAIRAQNRLTDELLARGPLDLVLWPESSFGFPVVYGRGGPSPESPEIGGRALTDFLRKEIPRPVSMLFSTRGLDRGLLDEYRRSLPQRGLNIAFLAGPDKSLRGLLEKRTLFPFGEFIPFGRYFPRFYRMSPHSYRLTPGGPPRLLATPDGARLGVLMCYEDILPSTAREFAGLGANVLVSMVEGTWFKEVGCEQHLLCSAPRAIENRKFMLRAANFGVTAVIDPAGRIVARLPPGAASTLSAGISLRGGRTPAAVLGRTLYWVALAALAALVWARLRPPAD